MPKSRLLQNDGSGKFADVAPEFLRDTGLVTSALWSDVDADGWIDLLVTHEWGAVKVFQNKRGSSLTRPPRAASQHSADGGIASLRQTLMGMATWTTPSATSV